MLYLKLLLILFLSSCSSNKNTETNIPRWYLEPQSSDSNYFYSTGKGPGKDTAIRDGLKEIATQIKSSVSSKFKQEIVTNNQTRSHTTQSHIEVETSKIEISGYKVINTFQNPDFDFFVLLQVEKIGVINNYKSKLNKLKSSIQLGLQYDDILLLRNLRKLNEELNELESVIVILISLEQDLSAEFNNIRQYENELRLKQDLISFSLKLNNQQLQQTANNLKMGISESGFKIADSESPIIMTIDGEVLDQKLNNLFLVKHKINIKLQDSKGEIYSSQTLEEIGSSQLSFEDANLNTGSAIKEKLKKVGFRKFFGIE